MTEFAGNKKLDEVIKKLRADNGPKHLGDSWEKAIHRAHCNPSLDPMPWKVILISKSPKAMASEIRLHTMKSMQIMERVHYRNPAYIVQWAINNERLAIKVGEATALMAAVKLIHDHVGTEKLS